MTHLLLAIGYTFFGMILLILIGAVRATRSDGFDDSNLFNWMRILFQLFIHPGDFLRLWYVDKDTGEPLNRPFEFGGEDEFSQVVKSRPPENAK